MEKLFYNPFHVTDTLVDTYYEAAHKGGSNAKYLYSSYIGKYLNISINNAVESSDACIYIIGTGIYFPVKTTYDPASKTKFIYSNFENQRIKRTLFSSEPLSFMQ